MRTSRISRDTAKIKEALSPSSNRRTRASVPRPAQTSLPLPIEEPEASPTKSRPVPENSHADGSPILRSGKRKRHSSPVTTTSITITKTARTSPRKKTVKLEEDVEIEEIGVTRARKVKAQPAKQEVDNVNGRVTIYPPARWEEMYRLTQEMRKRVLAPVDTMGCEDAAQKDRPPKQQRFQTLVSLMLSSQTKDTINALTMKRLYNELPPPGLTVENIIDVEPDQLNKIIWAVGFHNNKTKFIKATAEILRDKYDGDIPDTIEGLTSLPGVGPKMAYLCMSAAWGRDEGIGVDVHVHRITNLWGWHKTKTPEETRMALESWLPKDKWHEINHLLVGFGQTICAPVGRKCGECTLAEAGICPSAVVDRKKVIKKVKKEQLDGDVTEAKQDAEVVVAVKEEALVVKDL